MTSNARAGSRILGSLRSADSKGVVRIEDRYDTDIDDLSSALIDPGRLARWYGRVEGDLRAGGAFRVRLVERLRSMFDFEDVIVVLKDTVNVPPRPEDWAEVTKRGTMGLALYGA